MTRSLTKILLADDEPDIQEIAALSLEAIGGFTVETCDSGTEVVELARRFQPDFIILDVMMPGMDGPTTLKTLRSTEEFEMIPVVFLTAKAMTNEIENFISMGALAVITKPFDPESLSDQILAIWNKHHERC